MTSLPIQYATTTDGVRIAYASVGDGPPLVYASNIWGELSTYLNGWPHGRDIHTVDCGHDVMIDKPGEFAAILEQST